jgi:sulfatase modifying factor 1
VKGKLLAILVLGMVVSSIAFGQELRDYVSPTIGTLKYVPAGSFQRNQRTSDISVITQAFRMSQHEITRSQFLAIMGADPSRNDFSSNGAESPDDPVQNVSWYQAITFANKLSIAEGLTPVYSVIIGGRPVDWNALSFTQIPNRNNDDWNKATINWAANGYRLPTSMEWMWAAMGADLDSSGVWNGSVNTTGHFKPFAGFNGSNAIGDYVVYRENESNLGTTLPVGSKLPNELGLYDMTGNVDEWVWDGSATPWSWPNGTLTDYSRSWGEGPFGVRIIYGGSFANVESTLNSTVTEYRWTGSDSRPEFTMAYRGFRVVRR